MPDHPKYITTLPDGWLVAIPVAGKRAITKTFRGGDSQRDALLPAAIAWRDRAHQRLHGAAVPARSFHTRARETSATGVPGVRLVQKTVQKRTKAGIAKYVVPCIMAEVHTVAGRDYQRSKGSRSRLWSLNRYEWDEAIALATAWRKALVGELRGICDD